MNVKFCEKQNGIMKAFSVKFIYFHVFDIGIKLEKCFSSSSHTQEETWVSKPCCVFQWSV